MIPMPIMKFTKNVVKTLANWYSFPSSLNLPSAIRLATLWAVFKKTFLGTQQNNEQSRIPTTCRQQLQSMGSFLDPPQRCTFEIYDHAIVLLLAFLRWAILIFTNCIKMISPTQPYPQSQALCLLHPLWGGRVIMIKFCDVMMVLVIVVVVIEMMSICWYLRAVMVAPHEITLNSTFPLVRVNRHTWSMSKVKMMVLEIFHRWSRFCAILCKRDELRHQKMAEIIRWHHLKKLVCHLLAIRRSAKAVFGDRCHLFM